MSSAPSAPASSGRNLPVAIASGVLLAGAFLGSIAIDPWLLIAFVAVIVTGALLEVDAAVRRTGSRPATVVAFSSGAVMFFGTYTVGDTALVVGVGLLALATPLSVLLDRERHFVTSSVAATFLMTLWVPFLASFLGYLLARPDGEWYVMSTIALTVSNDIGAFAFGSAFGRHRLAPTVSPSKTWEGFAGGVLTVLVLAAFVTPLLVDALDVWQSLVFGGAIAVAATLGDLVESMIKRDLGIKDLGRIVPGHGGIMDRVDAMLFALPTAHLVLLALNR